MRIYVPLTLPLLAELAGAGELREHPEPFVAASEDEEEEYAALLAAADASAELQGPGERRVVLVADAPEGGGDDPVPMRRVLAVHADLPGADPDDDLAWFATQEIPDLLA